MAYIYIYMAQMHIYIYVYIHICTQVPLLIAAEVPLPRGHPATRPYLKKSYTLKYEGPGADRKNQSSIAIL